MTVNINYRQAKELDFPALAKLRSANIETHLYWIERIKSYVEYTHHPQKALIPRIIFVAERENKIIGFIAGHLTTRYACDGELEWIDVADTERKHGIATHLLKLLAQWFAKNNAKKICVDVVPENIIARKFYKKCGAVDLNNHWLVWNDINI